MLCPVVIVEILASATLIEGAAMDFSRIKAELGIPPVLRQARSTCLNSDLIQRASSLTGQENGTDGIKPGQALRNVSYLDSANTSMVKC